MRTSLSCLLLLAFTPGAWSDETRKPESTTPQVPYRLTTTNHVLVRVKINGKGPYNFLLDTGAPALFVSTAVCRKLGVKADADGMGKFDRFEIEGGVVVPRTTGRVEDPFQLEGMNGLGLAGAELHGMIGYTILARYRITFDFTKNKMTWQPLDYEPPPPLGMGGRGAPAGMDALGSLMKLFGALLGKKAEPEIVFRGFYGIVLDEKDDEVMVKAVLPGSPAAAAGLKAGDRISRFQGKAVQSPAHLRRLAARLAADETARLAVKRDGSNQTIEIKAGKGL